METVAHHVDVAELNRTFSLLNDVNLQAVQNALLGELDDIYAQLKSSEQLGAEKTRRLIHRLRGFSLQFHLPNCAKLAESKEQNDENIVSRVSPILGELYLTRSALEKFFEEAQSGRRAVTPAKC